MRLSAWRIVKAARVHDAFSGEGARLYPGRWNERGVPLVYTAGSLALASLELFVHLEIEEILADYAGIPIHFDASLCSQITRQQLPADWATDPIPAAVRELGSDWVRNRASAVLMVPSALIPLEHNFLLNPAHPDFHQIQIGPPTLFRFDPRLVKTPATAAP